MQTERRIQARQVILNSLLRRTLDGVLDPRFTGSAAVQLGALCWRRAKKGIEVLLVTSSEGRWILPKGWPIEGQTGAETALQEAWEEAGVKKCNGKPVAIGGFDCVKTLNDGSDVPCRISIYAVEVDKIVKSYPEKDRRKRRWVPIAKARELVSDEGLRNILGSFRA